MAGTWLQLARDLAERLDTDLPGRVAGSLGVEVASFRAELLQSGMAFHDPARGQRPAPEALERTANRLIRRATRRAVVSGAVGGMAGVAGVPPEVAWRLVQLLRLAQRLSLVYGQDPTTDRGRLLVHRALAAGFGLELPDQQGMGLRVSDLPAVLRDTAPTMHQGATWLAQAAVRQTTHAVFRPIGRMVPGLGAGPAAWRARRSMRAQGDRMHEVFRRAWGGSAWSSTEFTEAIEVRSSE